VVGAFHGLSRARSDARRYPAIDPLESWSKYKSIVDEDELAIARRFLHDGNEVGQMMKVVGEEGTSIDDFLVYLKAEYLDSVYLQQNAFNDVDAATPVDRQKHVFGFIVRLLNTQLKFENKDDARSFFQKLTQATRDWNQMAFDSDEFKKQEEQLNHQIAEVTDYA
jgi:V/A-type H+-transporting ATPase subunit A